MTVLFPPPTAEDIRACRNLNSLHGTSYYLATLFFPPEIRNAVFILYAFFRVPDELIDTKHDIQGLERFIDEWSAAYEGHPTTDPVLKSAVWVFHEYKIPFQLSLAFLDAMRSDAHVSRYATYADLERYMYGSAAVVGVMMTYIMGLRTSTLSMDEVIPYAEKLGYAMQLTNFLRDVGEDYRIRRRIYLPQGEMDRFGVREIDISNEACTDAFVRLMKYEISKARSLYEEAEKGIDMLSNRARLSVRIASRLYGAILNEIERQNYNVFSKRARTSRLTKLRHIISAAAVTIVR